MPQPPTLTELQALAERAIEHAEGEAQATVAWERDGTTDRLNTEITCVIDGRAARAQATDTTDEGLRRAAKAAALHARRPRAWPAPSLPRPQDAPACPESFDPSVLDAGPALRASGLDVGVSAGGIVVSVQAGASRVAIASTAGVRATEQRSHAIADVRAEQPGRTIRLRAAAPGPHDLPVGALVAHARELLLADREPVAMPEEDLHVVLGHDAVATLLDHLRLAFGVELDLGSGPLHGRMGTPVAAAAIDLSDSPRHPATLPRAFDAEGVPRRPVALVERGVATGRVHDSASATRANTESTGHASRAAALAPVPEHLVLAGGDAIHLAELCAPVGHGLYVPSLSPGREADGDAYVHTAHGAALIESGALTAPVRDAELRIEPLAVLASVEALSAAGRTLPLKGHAPGGPGAAVVPSLRATAGCREAS